jgi:hypothetical protein
MIAVLFALQMAAQQPEQCDVVRRDHDEFKSWAKANLRRFQSTEGGKPSSAERAQWAAFEEEMNKRIGELNRRYAACQKD